MSKLDNGSHPINPLNWPGDTVIKNGSVRRRTKRQKRQIRSINTQSSPVLKSAKIKVKPKPYSIVPPPRTKKIILHFVYGLRYFKNHSPFKDSDLAEHHFLLPRLNSKIPDVLSGSDLITTSNKTFLPIDDRGYLCDINSYKSALQRITPDAVLFSCTPPLEYRKSFNGIPTYYMHHGFITEDGIKKCTGHGCKYRRVMATKWKGFDKYFGIGRNFKRLIEDGAHEKDKTVLTGLTQFDYILQLNLETMKKSINSYYKNTNRSILFAGFQGYGKEYYRIVRVLARYAKDHSVKLYIKPRGEGPEQDRVLRLRTNDAQYNEIQAIYKSSHVTVIPDGVPIYNFFFADVILTQNSGSVIIEGMLVNKPSIQVQFHHKNDFMYIDQFRHIPQADNEGELVSYLNTVLSNNYQMPDAEKLERDALINLHTGCGRPTPDAWIKITDTILKDLK